jgi:phage tail P2-like protein
MRVDNIYNADYTLSLPYVLRGDGRTAALAGAASDGLRAAAAEIRKNVIYAGIGELPDEVLDILAYDFKLDWWDPGFSLAEKRAMLRAGIGIRRRLGTFGAVKKAISAIYPDVKIEEWFEYGGEPYFFRLDIRVDPRNREDEKRARLLSNVKYYKNVRSHLEAVYFVSETPFDTGVYTGAAAGLSFTSTELPLYWPDDAFGTAAYAGAADGSVSATILKGAG